MKTIYLAGGCFWCTEAVFKSINGVEEVVPGYIGGTVENPTYEAVCTGTTGHAEVVKILYDETLLHLSDLLEIFFATHDPTTLNRQGNDSGTQYRSAIFYTDEPSRDEAVKAIAAAQLTISEKIVTEVVPATTFYPAEEYHKSYYQNNASAPYCSLVISPKLEKLQKQFQDRLK